MTQYSTNPPKNQGLSIFGFIALIALSAAIVWSTLYVIKRPLPKGSLSQQIKDGAMNSSQTATAMTAPVIIPEAVVKSATTSNSTMKTASSTIKATTTVKTTPAKTTTTPAKKP